MDQNAMLGLARLMGPGQQPTTGLPQFPAQPQEPMGGDFLNAAIINGGGKTGRFENEEGLKMQLLAKSLPANAPDDLRAAMAAGGLPPGAMPPTVNWQGATQQRQPRDLQSLFGRFLRPGYPPVDPTPQNADFMGVRG